MTKLRTVSTLMAHIQPSPELVLDLTRDIAGTCFNIVLILMNKISCDRNCQCLKPQNGSFAFNIVLTALSGHNIQHPLRRFTAGCKVAGMTIRIEKPEAVVLCNYTVDGSLWIRVNCCLK